MSKVKSASLAAVAGFLVMAAPAYAKEYQVRMLNKGTAGAMVFEPAFVKVAPGDTVRFVPVDKAHNAEALPSMIPAGAKPFKGKMSEELVVPFTVPGLYGYKCLPHFGMGMVGLIQVKSVGNKAAVAAEAAKLPGLAKARMAALLPLAK
jgi:pseudoazurin